MKILLVDDESRKLKALHKIIGNIEGINKEDIDNSLDLVRAKSMMQKNRYDLVIMDLKICENLGEKDEQNSETAGLEFVEEIRGIDSIRTPIQIVFLTEFEELQKRCLSDERYSHLDILLYDEHSIEWENNIQKKIEYQLDREKSEESFSNVIQTDIAIICAVDCEMNAVKSVFSINEENKIVFENDSNNYYLKELIIRDTRRKVVFAQQREMGMVCAASLTQDIIYHFNPKYIFMAGIAAGIGENKDFGDILIATDAWNYSSGKYEFKNGETIFVPDPRRIAISPRLERIVRGDFDEALYRIRKEWVAADKPSELKVILGSLACGMAVIGSASIVEEMIKAHSRKAIGLDMESYGVYFASKYGIGTSIDYLCVKSISDFADKKKDDKYQDYAAYTSAKFVKHIIENELFK